MEKITEPEILYDEKIKWLMLFRAIFGTLLLLSTIFFRLKDSHTITESPLLFLYGITAGILILSGLYLVFFNHIRQKHRFAAVQLTVDTLLVSLIIFYTGNFASIFHFLYLIVIICSSMLLSRKGTLLIALICGLEFGIMVTGEYYGILDPFGMNSSVPLSSYQLSYTLYKLFATIAACFMIAILSSLLSEQERKSRQQLFVMGENVKRVEKMAVIGEMAAGLAHEIKNPLASLSGAVQLLRDDVPYDPEHDKLMQIVLREADRLSTLVTEFLIFARPQQGRVEVFQLDKVIAETVGLFEQDYTCREKIEFKAVYLPDIHVEMDHGQLRQVLWNLLLNAAESIKETGTIDVVMYCPDNEYVCIKISDNGCGIPENIMPDIFDPFFTTKKRGTGLGLSIVHRLLEFCNSQLYVDSKLGKGTAFTIRIKKVLHPLPIQNDTIGERQVHDGTAICKKDDPALVS